MLFSSVTFLYFFLPLVVALYFCAKNRQWRNGVLLVASLIFYSWGEPKFLLLMLASAFAAYVCGLEIQRYANDSGRKKLFFILSLIFLLGSLLVFKYLNFLCENISALIGVEISIPQITLPLGISFYTFQILSYVIDLYRGRVTVQKSYLNFLLYVSFFPQLIAGPIVRYETVEAEIEQRNENMDEALYGLRRFIQGLAKKVLLANNVALVADTIFAAASGAGTAALWLGAVCYTLQIYFDFSGYSDMAIGLGRIFGFHFLENFDYPYTASSITEFWRRWHISLGTWFRDYVYIPLGGNRVSKLRHIFNIILVWALTGMWHGASWNFLLWGLYNGLLLLAEKNIPEYFSGKFPSLVKHILTLFFVIIGWVIFRFDRIDELYTALCKMFSCSPTDWVSLLLIDTSICFKLLFILPAVIFSFPVIKELNLTVKEPFGSLVINGTCLALFAVSIMFIISSSYNPFIYFRF